MIELSRDCQKPRERNQRSDMIRRSITQSDSTSTSEYINRRSSPETAKESSGHHDHDSMILDTFPFNLPIDERLGMLRRYFVCLSRALRYLHQDDVRHKDIKPENILIDQSGNVVLTDFGISRKFPKQESHAMNNEWKFTRKYASPEIMSGRKVYRDDPSDVFSFGCVFVEMATLLLGKGLRDLSDHYTTQIEASRREDAYYCNLDRLYSWIEDLRAPPKTTSLEKLQLQLQLQDEKMHGQKVAYNLDQQLVEALKHIRLMLFRDPIKRPKSVDLWNCFTNVSPDLCRDCDPRHKEMWEPSDRQKEDSQSGLANRRSIFEEDSQNDNNETLSNTKFLSVQQPGGPFSRPSPPNMAIKAAVRGEERARSRPSSPRNNVTSSPASSKSMLKREMGAPNPQTRSSSVKSVHGQMLYDRGTDALYKTVTQQEQKVLGSSVEGHSLQAITNNIGNPHSEVKVPSPRHSGHHILPEQTATQPATQPLPQIREEMDSPAPRDTPSPETPIIGYDLKRSFPFRAEFGSIRGIIL